VVRRGIFGVLVAAVAMLACSGSALGRDAFVTNSDGGTVSVIATTTNSVLANVVVGKEPVDVAITPDGTRAYVVNKGSNTVSAIDTATGSVIANIVVGKEPDGIAIAPGGQYALVSNFGDEGVSAIDTATDSVIANILVGKEPEGIAIAPDSRFAYVARRSGGISVIDANGFSVVGEINDDPLPHSRLAIGPRGGRAFVTNPESASVSAFNPGTRDLVGPPIGVGADPAGIAIGPNGTTAYATLPSSDAIIPIDTSLDVPLSIPIGGFPGATGVAIAPNGLQGYVTDGTGSSVTAFDPTHNAPIGAIGVGSKPSGVAVVPDQGPQASFWISPDLKMKKKKLTFHGAGSFDPDGQIANYAWSFGDGGHIEGTAQTRVHRYRRPGEYLATLTVTDEEGCSTEQVFTGQTVSCNGSPAAVFSTVVTVVNNRGPALRLAGGRRQRLRGRVNVFARCPREACGAISRGTLVTVFERHGEVRRRRMRLPAIRMTRPSSSWRKLGAKLPRGRRRAAMRALRRGGGAKVQLAVVARAESGLRTLQRRTVKLVRPGRR
jgi:YVTN family beta-propeller protein